MSNSAYNSKRLDMLCKHNLSAFIQRSFQEVGNGKYYHNWHIDVIAEHLTACYNRDIKRLIINVPPRSLKSISVTIAFPAWALGHNPKLEIMSASYSQDLSEDHSVACRKIMRSDWYGNLFPDTILAPDQNQKSKFNTTVGGARRATSVGGTSIGKGGNILICFPYDELVATEHGKMKIGDIVTKRLNVNVWSYDTETGIRSLKSVINWKHNQGSDIVKVALNDGRSVKCTPDHRIFTINRGFVAASDLMASDTFPRFATNISKISNRMPFNVASCGYVEDTFCLTVSDNHTFYCGSGDGIVVANCDDPLSPLQASSTVERKSALNFLQQSWMTRLNNKKEDVSIVVMQRLHEQDPAGFLLAQGGWEHLFLPAVNDVKRTISIGNFEKVWQAGEYLDPERLGEETLEQLKVDLGSSAFAGQYMQRPSPEGGGIIKDEWWQLWEGKAPPKTHDIIQVYDTAFTEKTTNDFCARTTWGIFEAENGTMNIILLERMNKRLEFPELLMEAKEAYRKYTNAKTGEPPLVLIEEKASGLPLIQELRKTGLRVKGIKRNANSGDKISRCHNITHIFENGRVWLPCNIHEVDGKKHYTPKPYAQEVIDQCSVFPNGAHDDLVDTVVDAVSYLRKWREIKTDYDHEDEPEYNESGKKKRFY